MERILYALSICFRVKKETPLYASTATLRNATLFLAGKRANRQGKPFTSEDNKNVLDGN